MKVIDIINNCDGKLLCGDINKEVNTFSKDTRTITKNDVYIAIKGTNFNGNEYIDSAFEKGVSICIVDEYVNTNYKDKTIIKVNDTIEAIGKLAKYKRSLFKGSVIAITGSVGKTTTKDLIYDTLSKKYNVLKTPNNQNNNIGLPITILNSKDEEIWVLEMGMNHLNEIDYLSNIAKPNISVITNVGTSHIGNLGSRENILKAKLEILNGMDKIDLIINNDNDLLHEYYFKNSEGITTVGIDNNSDFNCIINDKVIIDNISTNINIKEKSLLLDYLLAYAVGIKMNVDKTDIIDALQNYKQEGNRLNIIERNGYTIINDSYNASYDSMKLALDVLNTYKTRKIAVLGDMLELGDFSKTIHKSVGLLITNDIDILVTIGLYSRYISTTAVNNGYKGITKHFETNDEVVTYLKSILKDDDVVLLKASNSMKLFDIVNKI